MTARKITSPHGRTLEVSTTTTPGMDPDAESWDVLDVETGQRFAAVLAGRNRFATRRDQGPSIHATPEDIDRALGLAVEGALAAIRRSGQKPAPVVEIKVSAQDVCDAMSGR